MNKIILVFILVFIALCFTFTMVGNSFPHITTKVLGAAEEGFSGFVGLDSVQLAIAIFQKNLISSLVVAFISCYLFGIPIFLFLLVNTALIGALLAEHPNFIVGLLPHGIIEIPAVCIALALGWHIWRRKEKKWLRIKTRDIIFFMKTVVPLLIIAAVVEVYITPQIISRYIILP